MASINISSVSTSTVNMNLISLDTTWNNGIRYPHYYIKTGGYPTESNYQYYKQGSSIANRASSGGSAYFSGLSSGTLYYVTCYVKYSGGTLATLRTTFRADTPVVTPSISSFIVTQTSTGASTARCSWSGSNISSGSSYTITVDGWVKASGTTSNSGSTTITLDYFQRYTATLQITSSGKTATKSYTFTMTAPVIPALSSFSVSPVSGTLQASCSWGITNSKSTVTIEIRASESSPSNYQTSGYQKGYYSYSVRSSTINFDKSGTFYVWINLFDNGSYIGSILKSFTTSLSKPSSWSWTQSELNAFANKGEITLLTRTRWNSFLSQINLAISFYNSSRGGSLAQISSGEIMGTDKIMYAVSFSSVCQKLNNLCSYVGVSSCGISSVATGGTIYGYYFTNLSAALNRAISAM